MARPAVAAALAALVVLPATSASRADPPSGRQAQLVELLRHDCGSCHGLTMKGGIGPALLPGDLADKPDDALAETILDGRSGTPMPPWRGLLTLDEVRWMVDALKQGLPR